MGNFKRITVSPLLFSLFPPYLCFHFPSCFLSGSLTPTFGLPQLPFPTTAKNQPSLQLPVGNSASKAEAEPAGNPRQMAVGRKQQKYTGSVRLPTCHDELPDVNKTTFSGSSQGYVYFHGYVEICGEHSDCLREMLNLVMQTQSKVNNC